MKPDKRRVALSQADFRKLVRGEVVRQDNVEIILMDIGFDMILTEVNEAYTDFRKNAL